MARWFAVAGGAGFVPVAPGTAGSVLAVVVFWAGCQGLAWASGGEVHALVLAAYSVYAAYAVLVAALFVVGVWASGRAEVVFGCHDDGRIVIDEVVGQLIALAPILVWLPALRVESAGLLPLFSWVVTGFVLFRVFDVWKPGAVRWAERRFQGGLGVMVDDVVAGVYGAVGLVVLRLLVPLVPGLSSWPSGASTAEALG